MIQVSDTTYAVLRRLGLMGDTFDDVITELLKKANVSTEVLEATA
jgi:predicted CopG family antitoxin